MPLYLAFVKGGGLNELMQTAQTVLTDIALLYWVGSK